MKFFKFLAVAAVALTASSLPAAASTINLSGVSASNVNESADDVNQSAAALNANIGSVVNSVVDVSATAANNVASIEVDVTQDASGMPSGNLSLVDASNLNIQLDDVNQLAVTANLSGALLDSTLDVGATAANNVATATVITVQK